MRIGATGSCALGQPETACRASRESARQRPGGRGVSHAQARRQSFRWMDVIPARANGAGWAIS